MNPIIARVAAFGLLLVPCTAARAFETVNEFTIASSPAATVSISDRTICRTPCRLQKNQIKESIVLTWNSGKTMEFPYPRTNTPEEGMIFFGDGALVRISERDIFVKLLESDDGLNDNYGR